MSQENRLRIVSFNCNSAKNKVDIIRELIKSHDIICLQETFLTHADSQFIAGLDRDINFCISNCTHNNNTNGGRPSGGLIIIWKSFLDKFISPVLFHENYLGIKIKCNLSDHLLINSYLPYDDHSTQQLAKYREILASLSDDLEYHQGCIMNIMGDLNADPKPTRFWREIVEFCELSEMTVADLTLPSDSLFTYLSPSHDSTSWLDHVIASRPELISNITILHYLCIFDHFPLSFDIRMEINITETLSPGINPTKFVNWKLFQSYKNEIYDFMNNRFRGITLINEIFLCDKTHCNDPRHKLGIEILFDYLIDSLLSSTEILQFQRNDSFKPVPGWNRICKEKYAEARENFMAWKEGGMDKNSVEFILMKNSRAEFKAALDYCRKS